MNRELRVPLRRQVLFLGVAFALGMGAIIGLGYSTGRLQLWFSDPPAIRVNDASMTDSGFVLATPLGENDPVLIDHSGSVKHRWTLPDGVAAMAAVLPDGTLMYTAAAPPDAEKMSPGLPLSLGLARVSWDGKLLWRLDDPLVHHDFDVLPDGTVAGLRWTPLPDDFAQRIGGGIPGTEFKGQTWADQIVEFNPDTGKERVVFDPTTALDPAAYPLPAYEPRSEWTHANSLEYIPSDPITGREAYLVSFRQIRLIALVARDTGEVLWSYGGDNRLHEQHDPSMTPDGHILVFDNGQYRPAEPSSSQVLEIDPATNKVVWAFPEHRNPLSELYSSIMGGAQRLPNGNTLITYAVPGRIVEVTPSGEIVWDYELWDDNSIFKARSYPQQLIQSFGG